MHTTIYPAQAYDTVASQLCQGQVVAFPTETVYGLAADASSDAACRHIYHLKGRASDNPFIIHLAHFSQIDEVAHSIPDFARHLMASFMPGPLTLVLPKRGSISEVATAGLNTVGIRLPMHPVAQQFLQSCGRPVAAPSANKSGRPSPTNASMVWQEMQGLIPSILDGGSCHIGLESTVISCLHGHITVLRAGAIGVHDLMQVVPDVPIQLSTHVQPQQAVLSPGQKYRHYSPSYPVVLSQDIELVMQHSSQQRIGLLGWPSALLPTDQVASSWIIRSFVDTHDYAQQLYASLVWFESQNIDLLLAYEPMEQGIGIALRDRLYRAAGLH